MPDPPPPFGFRPEFHAHGHPHYHQGHMPMYPPGAALSYPMPHMMNYPPMPAEDVAGIAPLQQYQPPPSESLFDPLNPPVHECGYCWTQRSLGRSLPDTAVRAGRDQDGCPIYAGRAFHEGDMVPAKIIPDKNAAYIAYGGEEILKEEFDVLCQGEFMWEFATNGEVPYGAVEVGQTADGEKLYMGRAMHEGAQTPGKIQVSHGCLYIPFNGTEVSLTEYEVLVMK